MADEPVTEAPEAPIAPDPVSDLQRERDDYHDRWLRKSAEFDNYRKRVDRERRDYADRAVVDVIRDLLLVVDDFDRALEVDAGPENAAAYRQGVALIHTKLHDLLRRHGVRPFEAIGTDFDPNVHEAVVSEASPEHRAGEVIAELQRGYMMGDRLLRPAMVKVATS